MISPFFVSEFKYVFGRILEGTHSAAGRIYIVKRRNFYNQILDFFVREGFIKGYKEFGELIIIYFSNKLLPHGGRRVSSITSIETVRWLNRRPSLRAKDLRRLQRRMGTSTLILNTDAGLLTLAQAVRHHVGGYPIFKIT